MKDIFDRFNLGLDKSEAEAQFSARADIIICRSVEFIFYKDHWNNIIEEIALEIGSDYKNRRDYNIYANDTFYEDLNRIKGNGLLNSMISLETINNLINNETIIKRNKNESLEIFGGWISDLIKKTKGVIGIRWSDGMFWPSGAQELDEKLVIENLTWIREKSLNHVALSFQKSLKHLLMSEQDESLRKEAIFNAYESLESLAKVFTGKDQELSRIRQYLVSKIKINQQYSEMLKQYIEFGCKFRHGHETPIGLPSGSETEAFIYITGVFMRIIIDKMSTI